jgi:hypothetical protein
MKVLGGRSFEEDFLWEVSPGESFVDDLLRTIFERRYSTKDRLGATFA